MVTGYKLCTDTNPALQSDSYESTYNELRTEETNSNVISCMPEFPDIRKSRKKALADKFTRGTGLNENVSVVPNFFIILQAY